MAGPTATLSKVNVPRTFCILERNGQGKGHLKGVCDEQKHNDGTNSCHGEDAIRPATMDYATYQTREQEKLEQGFCATREELKLTQAPLLYELRTSDIPRPTARVAAWGMPY